MRSKLILEVCTGILEVCIGMHGILEVCTAAPKRLTAHGERTIVSGFISFGRIPIMPTEMSAEELLNYLQDKKDLPTPLNVIGFVEAGEERNLSFSPGTNCEKWIPIPLSLVANASALGTRRCHDHTHNLVRLELKVAEDAEVKALQMLLMVGTGGGCCNEGQSNSRLLDELKAYRSQSAGINTDRVLDHVVCDSIGDITICTDGDWVCWHSPRTGYHC